MARRESTKAHWQSFWRDRSEIDEVYSNEGRIAIELERTAPLAGRRVLEVGAGSGRDAIDCKTRGAQVATLDYTLESLRIVKQLATRQGVAIDLICADATRMPFKSGAFDIVFHQGLMEHFRDPTPLLNENGRVLGSRGQLLVDVPQRFHIYTVGKHILILLNRWFAGWETEYSIGELESIVRSHDFEVRHAYGDWMVPGLFYRASRRVLLKLGIVLPKYPRVRPLTDWMDSFRARFRTTRLAFYTFLVIGVIGEKR